MHRVGQLKNLKVVLLSDPSNPISFHLPSKNDAKALYNLVKSSPPLDLNSAYYYNIICSHFASSCVVAKDNNKIIGFVSAYMIEKTTLFVWQVAVNDSYRGLGVAKNMLLHLAKRLKPLNIHTTITPSNKGSFALFKSVASDLSATYRYEKIYFSKEMLLGNEEEKLFEIFQIAPT